MITSRLQIRKKGLLTDFVQCFQLQEDKTEKSITDEDEFTLRRQLLNSLLDLFDTFALFKEKVSVEDNIEM